MLWQNYSCEVRNNSPRAPLFLPPGFAGSAGGSVQAKRVAYGCGRAKRLCPQRAECLAGAVRSAVSVQVCPFGPTCGGRLLSDKGRTVVSKEKISRFLLEKESAQRGGADFGSAAGAGKFPPGKSFLNALGPRATSGARPTAGAQPEFTSGVKRSRRRTSSAGRTVCLAQTGDGSRRALVRYRERKRSESGASSSLFFDSAFHAGVSPAGQRSAQNVAAAP